MKNILINTIRISLIIFLFAYILVIPVKATSVLGYNINMSYPNDTSINENTQITTSDGLLVITTDTPATCKYSEDPGIPFISMPENFDLEYGTIHKKILTGLIDGKYSAYIKCQSLGNLTVSSELGVNFWVNLPVSAQISLNNGQDIRDGKTEVTLTTSKLVSEPPQLSYTTDGSNYISIPLVGSGYNWNGYVIISGSNQNLIGSFKFEARDLEGNVGGQISSGAMFTIDTTPPDQLLDIRAESINQAINLTWRADESGLEYNIYRSTSQDVGYSDFYRQTSGNSFVDNSALEGQVYYYKVTGVDDAGNEGPLSTEVYASPTFSNDSITNSVLDTRYIGLVDNTVQADSTVVNSIRDISDQFSALSGENKEIAGYLKISNSISSAQNNINALISEIGGYKLQTLSEDELNKKLSSAQVRLNVIKSNVPESINIINESSLDTQISENDLNSAFLQIKPELDYNQLGDLSKASLEEISSGKFKVNGTLYYVEVSYLDGTKKQYTLIKKDISFTDPNTDNKTFLEVIPKEFAQSSNDLTFSNENYNVLKEDPIFSFTPDTTEIVYFVNNLIDVSAGTKIETVTLDTSVLNQKASSLTGFATLSNVNINMSNSGMYIGIVIISILLIYLFILKMGKKETIELRNIKISMENIKKSIAEGNNELAIKKYKIISEEYKNLDRTEKEKVYSALSILHQKILRLKEGNYNKSILTIIGLSCGLLLLLSSFSRAMVDTKNNNFVTKNITVGRDMTVREFILNNPGVKSITYKNDFLNESYGFLNVFGGVGKNFIMYPGEIYEINIEKNTTLII